MKRENAVLLHFSSKIATTWINLQDAYTVEATNVGTWSQIGYNAPGTALSGGSSSETSNFTYADGKSGDNETWTATAKNKLNECNKGNWIATASATTDAEAGTTYVNIETDGTQACLDLTPSFDKLARSSN